MKRKEKEERKKGMCCGECWH